MQFFREKKNDNWDTGGGGGIYNTSSMDLFGLTDFQQISFGGKNKTPVINRVGGRVQILYAIAHCLNLVK